MKLKNAYGDLGYNFPFPDREVSPVKKSTKEYTINVAEAIWARYKKNETVFATGINSIFSELRDYGRGSQDEDKYKRYLQGGSSETSGLPASDVDGEWTRNRKFERKGWMNVNWDILSPAVKIRNMIHGLFDDIDFDVIADAVDANSGAEEETRKWKLWINTRTEIASRLKAMRTMAGLENQPQEFTPVNLQELELLREAGSFKMAYAIETEKLLRHLDDVSDWDHTLKRKLLDDLIDLNTCFAKCDYDSLTKKLKWRYVDPKNLVIQISKEEDFEDSEYAGEIKEMKITELRQRMYEEGYDEEDVKLVAQSYLGHLGNPAKEEWETKYDQIDDNGAYGYDDFRTHVFCFEWIESDVDKEIKFTNKYGKIRLLPYDAKKKLGNREELVKTTVKFLYKGTWIIGTDYAFDYGRVNYQPRPTPKRVRLTYKGIKIQGKSITMSLIPIYDNIQIGWLKYQNSLAQAFEAGYAIDYKMISNISNGEENMDVREVIKMWKETGVLPYMSSPAGSYYRGGATVPVSRIEGGMGESLNQAMARLQMQYALIEQTTGLSPVALGGTPDPEAPVTTTERSLEATHNALKPLINGIFTIKGSLAKVSGPRIQQLLKYNDESRKEYEKVIGKDGVKTVLMAQSTAAEYGYKLEARPTRQDRMALMDAAQIALQSGQNGNPGIDFNDYTYMIERLNGGGNIKKIRLYLSAAKRKAEQKSFQQQQQLIQQQTEGNMKAQQQKMEYEAQAKQMDGQIKLGLINAQGQNDIKTKFTEQNIGFMRDLQEQSHKEMMEEKKSINE